MTDDSFNWGDLGQQWWEQAATEVGADLRQTRFAAARQRGCSATQSAREAGYSDDGHDSIRSTAYRVGRSNVVRNLLALAAGEAGEEISSADASERRNVLTKLLRNSDPQIKIRAIEALNKMDEATAERSATPTDDGLSEERTARGYLEMPNGAIAFALLWRGCNRELSSLPMLVDVATQAKRENAAAWDQLVQRITATDRSILERRLNDATWHIDCRQKIWAEAGIDIPAGHTVTAPVRADAATSET